MTTEEKLELIQEYKDVCEGCKPFMVLLSGSVRVGVLPECRVCHQRDVTTTWDEDDAMRGDIVFIKPYNQ